MSHETFVKLPATSATQLCIWNISLKIQFNMVLKGKIKKDHF